MRDVFIRYKKAAEEGHDLAQYMVGLMYANGDGVDKDVRQTRQDTPKSNN